MLIAYKYRLYPDQAQKGVGFWSSARFAVGREIKQGGHFMGPQDIQVGGDHYKRFKIQPGVFCEENGLSFWESCVIKRICRYRHPGGKGVQDLEKIKHEVDMLIAQHYPGVRFCECGAAMQECQSVTHTPVYVCKKCGRHDTKEL